MSGVSSEFQRRSARNSISADRPSAAITKRRSQIRAADPAFRWLAGLLQDCAATRDLKEECMPKIDIAAVPERKGSSYPAPFDAPCAERLRQRIGNAGGLTDFGVNLLRLPPGVWSSQRHWHSHEDEFVYVLEGEVTLIEEDGETLLRPGDCAAFPKKSGNGHHLINRSDKPALLLELGSRSAEDQVDYPDIDLKVSRAAGGFVHKDGRAY
jgi:uncharacterized cupin superfamily protein